MNHPHLHSIYPPVAQAAFALAHWLHPWTISAWRLVLFLSDVLTLVLLIILLKTLNLPFIWLVTYWWNPVLIKEVYNSNHMDVIVLPFVLGAVLLTIRGSYSWAAVLLALAVGTKLWPIVLLPVVLRPIITKPKRLVPALCLFTLLAGAIFFPVYSAGLDSSSGFMAYGRSWEMNDALFMPMMWGVQTFLKDLGVFVNHGQLATRVFLLVLLAAWIAWLSRREATDPADICERCSLIIAGVFLLSPTQFPWYYIWLLPFLAIRPRISLLLLTPLLPLYYLRFYFAASNNTEIFDFGIVWLEYVPVWYLLFREWRLGRRSTLVLEVAA